MASSATYQYEVELDADAGAWSRVGWLISMFADQVFESLFE